MKSPAPLVIVGLVLLAVAWFSAGRIPQKANRDFERLVAASGGYLSHSPGFPDLYKQTCANSRMLQNAYVGGTGLVCLAVGLGWMRRRADADAPTRTTPPPSV